MGPCSADTILRAIVRFRQDDTLKRIFERLELQQAWRC